MAGTPQILSGSTSGAPIAIGTSNTLLHTAVSGSSDVDMPVVLISNPTTSSIEFTLVVNSVDVAKRVIPAKSGWVPVAEDGLLNGALTVHGRAASTGMYGWGKNIRNA